MSQKPKKSNDVQTPPETPVIHGYKGFDSNLQCRGYQFEVGKTFEHQGRVQACESGFHLCENPFDVLNYYSLYDSRFAKVTATGAVDRHGKDSKVAAASITIEAELKLPDFVKSAITYLWDLCKGEPASGDDSKLAASGDDSKLAASGNYSKLAASGYNSKLAASGDDSKLAASGNYSKLAASGYNSKLAASGYNSKLAASGDDSQLAASGESSIAIAAAPGCMAKAGNNGTIVLARWVEDEKRYRVSVAYIGENGIKANVWYRLNDQGEFVEVPE